MGYSFTFITPAMMLASGSYLMISCGFAFRKNKNIHAPCMAIGVLTDLGLVLTLEIQRHAVETALQFSLGPLQMCHIATSTLATILYFPMLVTGLLRMNGRGGLIARKLHLRFGPYAYIFRTMGYVLMFSMLK
jgi:hypothetical protein